MATICAASSHKPLAARCCWCNWGTTKTEGHLAAANRAPQAVWTARKRVQAINARLLLSSAFPGGTMCEDLTRIVAMVHLQPRRRRWCAADAERASLFTALFDGILAKHAVLLGQLTLHADSGGPMKTKATALMLADLSVTKSPSRTAGRIPRTTTRSRKATSSPSSISQSSPSASAASPLTAAVFWSDSLPLRRCSGEASVC